MAPRRLAQVYQQFGGAETTVDMEAARLVLIPVPKYRSKRHDILETGTYISKVACNLANSLLLCYVKMSNFQRKIPPLNSACRVRCRFLESFPVQTTQTVKP